MTRTTRFEIAGQLWEWLFLLWTALIPEMIWFHLRFLHRYAIPLADFVFLAAALAFVVSLLLGVRRLRRCSWYLPLLAYAITLAISTFTSGNVRRSAPKMAGDLYLVAAAILTVNYVIDRRSLRRTLYAWIAGAALTICGAFAGLALFSAGLTRRNNPFLFQFGSLPAGHYPRIRSLLLNANATCSYITVATMLIVAARQGGWISRRVFHLLIVGCIVTAAFSLSPGLGGFCLALALWLARLQGTRAVKRVFAAAGILAAIVFFAGTTISPTPMAKTSFLQTVLHPEPAARVLTWKDAWHSFLRRPWLGNGLESEAADVHYLTANGQLHHNTDAHNTWLSIMSQQGVVGIVAFLWVVVHLVRRFRGGTGLAGAIELAFIGGVLYPTLSGSFENTRHVWALMGLIAAIQEFPGTPSVNRSDLKT